MSRAKHKYHYLYKTTNNLNGKYYYGIHSTSNLDDNYLGSGKILRYSIRKYGKENFKREILEMFDSREDLIQAEIDLITRVILEDKQCMNINFGGHAGKLMMVSVKDKYGNTFSVFVDDPRFLSGELVHVTKNKITAKDKYGTFYHIDKTDVRYLSGEFVGISKNKFSVKDKDGNTSQIDKDDSKYLSGELVSTTSGKVNVKDKDGNTYKVDKTDPRYLSGELIFTWKDKKHSDESKQKMSESSKGTQLGEKNGSFGTCWITKDTENKKIKKKELDNYLLLGWIKGRKILNL